MDRLPREVSRLLRDGWQLTLVMVIGLGCGIGLWGLSGTIRRQLRLDTVAGANLYQVSLERDFGDMGLPNVERHSFQAIVYTMLTPRDASALAALAGPGAVQTAAGNVAMAPEGRDLEEAVARFAPARLFALFGLPFAHGAAWQREDDAALVLSAEQNDRWFGGRDSTGEFVRVGRRRLRIAGVLAREYQSRAFDIGIPKREGVFLPWAMFHELKVVPDAITPVPDPNAVFAHPERADDVFVRLWVELPDAADRDRFAGAVSRYAAAERATGRSPRVLGAELIPYAPWRELISNSEPLFEIFRIIGLFVLAGCTLNLVRLLVVRFAAQAAEVAIRRAMGASRRMILTRHLLEAALIGVAAGVLGMVLCAVALPVFDVLIPDGPFRFFFDRHAALSTVIAGPAAAVAAALYPSWRSTGSAPAAELRLR